MSRAERLLGAGILVLALGACTPPAPSSDESHDPPSSTSADAPDGDASSSGPAEPEPSTSDTPPTPTAPQSTPGGTTPDEPTDGPTGPVATDEPVAPPSGDGAVPVTLTFAAWDAASGTVAVGAYVETTVAGECTLEVTSGDIRLVASSATVPDVSTTSCGDLAIDLSGQPSGPWNAVVSYSAGSGGGSGTSSAQTFEVSR